jgi:beta-galactosidase
LGNSNAPHGLELNSTQTSGSNNYQGEAWYRKHFTIPENLENKRLNIHFEAIMGKCKIWLNGELLTTHFGGYLPFNVYISGKIKKGEKNIIAIWADNSDDPNFPPRKPQTRLDFSYFGGIYRDVWLVSTNEAYITNSNNANKIAGGGVFVHYENLSDESVKIIIQTDISNSKSTKNNFNISYVIKDLEGTIVAKKKEKNYIETNTSNQITSTLKLNNPNLWSPKKPYLYNLEISISDSKNEAIDGVKQNYVYL